MSPIETNQMKIEDEEFQKEVTRVAEGFNLYLKALADKFNSLGPEEKEVWIKSIERGLEFYDNPTELGPYTKKLMRGIYGR
jgi:hypothetical protein